MILLALRIHFTAAYCQSFLLVNTATQEWFFDMIIGFLRSPRWKTPVMSFLDANCAVFDDAEENKLEFTSIHNVSVKEPTELIYYIS